MRYIDELDSAVYEGDTVYLKYRTEQLLDDSAHHRLPRLVALIERLAESAESCIFSEIDVGGIGSPNLTGADRNIFS